MKTIKPRQIISTVLIVLMLIIFSTHAFAYSENTQTCIDRVQGVILGRLNNFEFNNEINNRIASFCLSAYYRVQYSELTEIARLAKNMVEDFFAKTAIIYDLRSDIAAPLFKNGDFGTNLKQSLLEVVDRSTGNISDLKNSYLTTLNNLLNDGYSWAAEDIVLINREYEKYQNLINFIKNGIANNYVCEKSDYSNQSTSNCRCFTSYQWDSIHNSCTEIKEAQVQPISVPDVQIQNDRLDESKQTKISSPVNLKIIKKVKTIKINWELDDTAAGVEYILTLKKYHQMNKISPLNGSLSMIEKIS